MQTHIDGRKDSKQFHILQSNSEDRIKSLDASTFESLVLKGEGPIAVEFMSYGCEHCRVLEPVLQDVAAMMETKAKIFRVNVEMAPEIAQKYKIEGTPTLVMFLNGKKVGRAEGPTPTVQSILTALAQPFRGAK